MKKTLRKAFTILTATMITTIALNLTVLAKDVSDYTDVHETDWFYTTVADVADKGLMLGTSDSTFAPTQNLERGQLATILYRMSGDTSAYGYRFPDVPDGIFYSDAITWAADAGVVSGYNDGTFGPSDKITREQLATMLYRYAGRYGYDTSVTGDVNSFSDGSRVSGFAADSMSWAVGAGILKGEADGRLNPQGDVSRAVAATMISRLGKLEKSGDNGDATDDSSDEVIYVHQWEPVYEEQPVYGEVTKYRMTTMCNCGAIDVYASELGDPNSPHCGHALGSYQVAYTETVQTGTQRVQVGWSCACGATKGM